MNADERPYSTRLSDYSEKNLKKLPGLEKKQYWYQFASLNYLLRNQFTYKRLREQTEWCMNVFSDTDPFSIEDISWKLTRLVDSSLRAVNSILRWSEYSLELDKKYIERIRRDYDKLAFLYSSQNYQIFDNPKCPERGCSEKITYRIPAQLAATQVILDNYIHTPGREAIGRCEEHVHLTIYFLTIAHMIQDLPFGQLRNDIFYTAVARKGPIPLSNHTFVILVKGSEFKLAIQKAKESIKTGEDNIVSWLIKHTEVWGENAWIVDGWQGRAMLLKEYSKIVEELSHSVVFATELDYFLTEAEFLRNRVQSTHPYYREQIVKDTGIDPDPQTLKQFSPKELDPFFESKTVSTEWDVTIRRMIKRIESKSS